MSVKGRRVLYVESSYKSWHYEHGTLRKMTDLALAHFLSALREGIDRLHDLLALIKWLTVGVARRTRQRARLSPPATSD